jgi:O-antigen ligase
MTKDRPWLGVGYGVYAAAYPEYRRKVVITEMAYEHMGAHSEPVRIISETGLVGIAVSLWLIAAAVVLGVRVYRRDRDRQTSLLVLAALSALATYIAHTAFNSYPGVDKVTIPFWASLGLLAGLGRVQEEPTKH